MLHKELTEETYNRIFNKETYYFSKDLNTLKLLILNSREVLREASERVLFIYALANKIKEEKLNIAEGQIKQYGEILMNNYTEILHLHNWLEELNQIEEDSNEEVKDIWIQSDEILIELSEYLKTNDLIEDTEIFYKVFTDSNFSKRINWLGKTTLLIYLINELKDGYIHKNTRVNSFIEYSFLKEGIPIKNIKQSKTNTKLNKSSKPHNHTIIDTFIAKYRNPLPKKS